MTDPRTITARWVFPASSPPLERGVVTVRGGVIEAVGPAGSRAADEDLGNAAIIPGLVNPHTHLDLSGARDRIPPTSPDRFTDWLLDVIAFRRRRSAEETQADVRDGLAECLRAGTTLLGDITVGGSSYPAVAAAELRANLFWEVIGLSHERCLVIAQELSDKAGLGWFDDKPLAVYPQTPTLRWEVSPHAPYSVNHDYSRGQLCIGGAAIHLAESPGELELLAHQTGPFVDFLKELGVWDPSAFTAGLIDFLISAPKTCPPRLYVHCNYLPPDAPFNPTQTVVYCPRTHAAFGHPPHPFREFLARGVRVCLGTDSLASNPDLDVFAEAQFVHERYPDFDGAQLLRMVTLAGAEGLGWATACGSLEAGKSADLVALPLPDRDAADPHELLWASDGPRRTMFRGAWRADSGPVTE